MDVISLKKRFIEIYGGDVSDIRVFTSPGRVNLIGEHTDYNGGYVFPAALTVASTVAARPRNDRNVRLAATDLSDRVEASLDELEKYKKLKWGNYQLGVADELQKAGFRLTGCDMLFDITVPFGAGLSSSAAIEVSTAVAFIGLSGSNTGNPEIDLVEVSRICQKAENNYVGVNCGIMDQFASALGRKNHAILLNCKNLDYKHIPIGLIGYKIVISNTNKKRSLAESKYNERRNQCEEGLELLKKVIPGITCLGDVSLEQYEKNKDVIGDDIIRKRVEHVITEDNRVLESINALHNGDMGRFGQLMVESHQSLKNLYEVTGMELDALVEEALKIDGVIGSRMTGAGFGGCTVSIVREDAVEKFIDQVGSNYLARTGITPAFYISDIGDGARELV